MSAVVYRFRDAHGTLLYVGCSGTFGQRLDNHASSKAWFTQVADISVEHYPSRPEALAAEAKAIRDEAPIHNVQSSPLRHEVGKPTGRPRGWKMDAHAYGILTPYLSTTRVAELADVPAVSLRGLRAGTQRAGKDTAKRIADALGVSVPTLFPEAAA